MTDIQPFTYKTHAVRVITIDGEPWFVLADLCKVLDLAKPSRVAMRIADDMKGAHLMSTLGGDQEMTTVSEAGMYEDEKSKFNLGLSSGDTRCVNEADPYSLALAARRQSTAGPVLPMPLSKVRACV